MTHDQHASPAPPPWTFGVIADGPAPFDGLPVRVSARDSMEDPDALLVEAGGDTTHAPIWRHLAIVVDHQEVDAIARALAALTAAAAFHRSQEADAIRETAERWRQIADQTNPATENAWRVVSYGDPHPAAPEPADDEERRALADALVAVARTLDALIEAPTTGAEARGKLAAVRAVLSAVNPCEEDR